MPTWGEILQELNTLGAQLGYAPFDEIRRKYLTAYAQHTGRDVILYASGWIQRSSSSRDPSIMSINDEDLQGFMEVMHGLSGTSLDLILHSPGGSVEAAEAIVNYIRSKFTDVRVIVPQAAMSAACMVACSGNTIVMGKHSSLGPIDPQFIMRTPNLGVIAVPAQAILDQFELAKQECATPGKVNAWVDAQSVRPSVAYAVYERPKAIGRVSRHVA